MDHRHVQPVHERLPYRNFVQRCYVAQNRERANLTESET